MAKSVPKSLSKIKVEDLPETPSDELYFQAKKTVLAYEISAFLGARNFIALEDALHEYGEFLLRHPEAESKD